MFGIFKSDQKKVQRLRLEFEDVRQRVLMKMDGYERQNFWVVFSEKNEHFSNLGHTLEATPSQVWLQFQNELKRDAEKLWLLGRKQGGSMMGQDLSSASNAIAFLSIKCGVNAFKTSEADILRADIFSFETMDHA